MQIDMHYYGTYCLARSAGLTREAARVIANATQFVDDNAEQSSDASFCDVAATTHHAPDLSGIDKDNQRQVWVPFHFLPGNEGEELAARLVCRKDSAIAREMCENHLQQFDKSYFLPLIGIMAHVYGDTFAHYGFFGVSSQKNKQVNDPLELQEDLDREIKDYILNKKALFGFEHILDSIKSKFAENLPDVATTLPDQSYFERHFDYEDNKNSEWHKSPEVFLEFSEKIHNLFKRIADQHLNFSDPSAYIAWSELAPKVKSILRVHGKLQDRIDAWKKNAQYGNLLNIQESIPDYQNWNDGFQGQTLSSSDVITEHPIYEFNQAASYHRWYVLRKLLPSHGLTMA